MIAKLSSKNQITIPKSIADTFDLKKVDALDVKMEGNYIIMIPKEVILKDKYPVKDLKKAEEVLSKGIPGEEIAVGSGKEMMRFLKKRNKK